MRGQVELIDHSTEESVRGLKQQVLEHLEELLLQTPVMMYWYLQNFPYSIPEGKLCILLGNKEWDNLPTQTYRVGENSTLVAKYMKGYLRIEGLSSDRYTVEDVIDLIDLLLPEVVEDELVTDPDELKKLAAEVERQKREKAKEAWTTIAMSRHAKTIAGTKKSIEAGNKKIEDLQRKLTEEVRRLNGKERKLRQLEAETPNIKEIYGAQFESAMRCPQIERVEANPDNHKQINIFTTELVAHVGEYHKLLGRYRIEIYMDGSNGGVKAFNLDRQVDGYWRNCQHPHIENNGTFCLGTLQEAVPQLIGDDQITGLALMIINHLQHGIEKKDPAGAYIKDWPDIPGYYEKLKEKEKEEESD